jgi:lipopolysaccharide/colanic/teichoic acid biosynthesis glycosyltransferase
MEPLPVAALPTSEPAGHRLRGMLVRTATAQGIFGHCCKRVVDLVLGTLLGLLLLPLLLLIAILIRLDSPGPVIFVQERVGARRRSRHGQTAWEVVTFPCYKFRSMVRDANQSAHEAHVRAFVEERLDTTRTVKLTGDPRVTRVGRFLRRSSLDELPQLANVLKGDMSLVGPRPVPAYEAAAYLEWHRERLAALPGITGWWQVKGRGLVSFTEMVRMDIAYVRNQSLWLDIKILLATIPAVLSGRGAE